MQINRYKFNQKGIDQVLKRLKDNTVKGLPNWYKKLQNKEQLKEKDGKLFLGEKQIVPTEKVGEIIRNAFYQKDSKTPWSRDAGYADLSKRYIGISKRAFATFAQTQRVKIRTDNVPKKIVKKGRKLSKKGIIEIDLFQTSRKDLPTYIQKTFPDSIEKLIQHYTLTMVDKLTSLTFLSYIGTGKKTKSRENVMKHVNEGRDFFEKMLGVPKAKQKFLRDAGGEFDPSLPGHVIKLGPLVESRNSFAQRVQHRLLAAKRGSLKSVIKQAQEILNNTKSRNLGKTPNEAAGIEQAELAPKYNKARQVGKPTAEKKLSVGDMVRFVTKDKKKAMFKAYKGTSWSAEKFKIVEVGKTKPYRYKFKLSKKVKGGGEKAYHVWKYRDQISSAEQPHDQKSEARLAKLTPTGKVKAIPKPAEKKKPVVQKPQPIRKSGRLAAKKPVVAKRVPKPKKLTAEQRELKTLQAYVRKEERLYPTYDNLSRAKQGERLAVWNKNIARGRALIHKGVSVKGVPKNFFQ
jgi:hypothetical protein